MNTELQGLTKKFIMVIAIRMIFYVINELCGIRYLIYNSEKIIFTAYIKSNFFVDLLVLNFLNCTAERTE